MSNSTSSGWSSDVERASYSRRAGRVLLQAGAVGVLAGMGAFVYNSTQFLTFDVDARLLLAPMFAAGVFAHAFAPSLRESVRLGIAGFFAGLAVFVAAWLAPLFVLPFPDSAIDLLLPSMMGDVTSAAFLNYSPTYLGGYLLAVSVGAFLE
ncbi:hypothetical protein [Halorussus halobius]|uniref:hypothetical protein n=1 Tax=Halorussus halobius TaxID=1710537 RepID=UPI0010918B70|nr:hypothetical protein [Halorussus halobius]